jgi:AraC-like DNA-binding protein
MAVASDSPFPRHHPAHSGAAPLNKIGPAIRKERREASSRLLFPAAGGQMSSINRSNGNGSEPVRIWKARNFIEAHVSEELSLGKVARATNTSPNYFSEKFKEATGMNFVRYVARTRFEKAAAFLRERDLRVSEIAFATGFQSLSQFNRVFRKFAGKSPTEYRAALRNGAKRSGC